MKFVILLIDIDIPLQVVAGELELKECNLNWSPEDFESKLQVRAFSIYILNGNNSWAF